MDKVIIIGMLIIIIIIGHILHTKNKEGNNIDKICARDFWKGRDSYRKLQDACFNHVKFKDFDLERGVFIEDTGRKHYSVAEYKNIPKSKRVVTVFILCSSIQSRFISSLLWKRFRYS